MNRVLQIVREKQKLSIGSLVFLALWSVAVPRCLLCQSAAKARPASPSTSQSSAFDRLTAAYFQGKQSHELTRDPRIRRLIETAVPLKFHKWFYKDTRVDEGLAEIKDSRYVFVWGVNESRMATDGGFFWFDLKSHIVIAGTFYLNQSSYSFYTNTNHSIFPKEFLKEFDEQIFPACSVNEDLLEQSKKIEEERQEQQKATGTVNMITSLSGDYSATYVTRGGRVHELDEIPCWKTVQ